MKIENFAARSLVPSWLLGNGCFDVYIFFYACVWPPGERGLSCRESVLQTYRSCNFSVQTEDLTRPYVFSLSFVLALW